MSGLSARALAAIADAVRPGLWTPPGSAAPSPIDSSASVVPISADRIAAVRAEFERRRTLAISNTDNRAPTSVVADLAPAVVATPAAWRAEWQGSASLQAEFADVETYVALRKGEAAGRVKVISKLPAATSAATTPEGWRAEWEASSALQAEFADVGAYVALRKAEKAGRVRL